MATEYAVPLTVWLAGGGDDGDVRAAKDFPASATWGLYALISALSFFTQDASVLHKLHTIMVDRAQHVDKQARAEANAAFHALSSLDTSLGRVLEEEGLLFDGASVSGSALLAKFAQD